MSEKKTRTFLPKPVSLAEALRVWAFEFYPGWELNRQRKYFCLNVYLRKKKRPSSSTLNQNQKVICHKFVLGVIHWFKKKTVTKSSCGTFYLWLVFLAGSPPGSLCFASSCTASLFSGGRETCWPDWWPSPRSWKTDSGGVGKKVNFCWLFFNSASQGLEALTCSEGFSPSGSYLQKYDTLRDIIWMPMI